MATLRPPSASPSPSPSPGLDGRNNRSSMGHSHPHRGSAIPPASPRPGGGSSGNNRPTSELLGGAGMFQTPEADAIDQWFENLQNYEATLEEMAAASLDVNFKEELSAIEQWFKVLSEAERTAALYSLLQHSTQVQIRFFITVLQQMARSDPMTALLSPAMGGSMQSQMEAKLASMNLKSPGLMPPSPSARNFSGPSNGNRQSLAVESTSSNFLSPDSAAQLSPPSGNDAAATLAQQRAKLKASNSAHRISAPALGIDGRSPWGPSSQLGQVVEQNAPAQEITIGSPSSRPKSTEFSGSPRPANINTEAAMSPLPGESWANMVNTPLIPMFQKDNSRNVQNVDSPAPKAADWNPNSGAVPRMGDPKIYRRHAKSPGGNDNEAVYDNDGNLVQQGYQGQQQRRNVGGNANGQPGWNQNGGMSPALSNASGRFGNNVDEGNAGMNGLGFGGMGMGMASPGLGMPGMGMGPMGAMNPFNVNMMNLMGVSPEAQLLAAQMAASGFGAGNWGMGMNGMAGGMNGGMGGRPPRAPGSTRSTGGKSGNSNDGRGGGGGGGAKKDEEEVDPRLLEDIPAWLRSLRLHKYTPNFEGHKWQDMVVMDEAALEKNGVAALGARRKMLKTFELVREKMGIKMPE